MKSMLLLATILSCPLAARTWTAADGRKLEADFISASETEVTLKRDADGVTFTLPLTRLSESDQEFIKEQPAEDPAPAPETSEAKPIEGKYAGLITGEWELSTHDKLPFAFYGGKDFDGAKKYPLVVSLHGKSSNNENGKQLGFSRTFVNPANFSKRPCLVLAPLCYQPFGDTGGGWNDAPGTEALDLVQDLVKELPIVDPDRIYVLGYSMGGYGTWRFLKEEPRLFAAGVPIAGGGHGVGKLKSMPIWAFHGDKDNVVDVAGARACADELKRSKVFKYTEIPGGGHGIIGEVMADQKLHEWLFEQKR